MPEPVGAVHAETAFLRLCMTFDNVHEREDDRGGVVGVQEGELARTKRTLPRSGGFLGS
jgi:hypothetical protein